jgi:hypothetical protein
MTNADPTQRRMAAQLAANIKWGTVADRTAATAAMRRGFEERFVRMAREAALAENPKAVLSSRDIALRAEAFRRAHFLKMAMKSAQARGAKTHNRKGNSA